MMRWGQAWALGMSGEIAEVPEGFRHETVLVSGKGVTAAVDYYGGLMRAAHGTRKVPSPRPTHLNPNRKLILKS